MLGDRSLLRIRVSFIDVRGSSFDRKLGITMLPSRCRPCSLGNLFDLSYFRLHLGMFFIYCIFYLGNC